MQRGLKTKARNFVRNQNHCHGQEINPDVKDTKLNVLAFTICHETLKSSHLLFGHKLYRITLYLDQVQKCSIVTKGQDKRNTFIAA